MIKKIKIFLFFVVPMASQVFASDEVLDVYEKNKNQFVSDFVHFPEENIFVIGRKDATDFKSLRNVNLNSNQKNFTQDYLRSDGLKIFTPDGKHHYIKEDLNGRVMNSLPKEGKILVYFDLAQHEIRENTKKILKSIRTLYGEDIKIDLKGYTCPLGNEKFNLALGQNRAEAISNYLKGLGFKTITFEGKGGGYYLFEENEELFWENRRVEIYFSK